MLMEIDNILKLHHSHTYQEVSACAQEVATYIGDHDNWQKPILPEENGCSAMNFEPERFDFQFYSWICREESTAGEHVVKQNIIDC